MSAMSLESQPRSSASRSTAPEIVIFQPEFREFGGQERVIVALTKKMADRGRATIIVCYSDALDLERHAGVRLNVLQLQPGSNPFRRVAALRRCLQSFHRAGHPPALLVSINSAYHAGLAVSVPYHLWIPDTYDLLCPFTSTQSQGREPDSLRSLPRHLGTRRGILRATRFVTNAAALQSRMSLLYGRAPGLVYLGGSGAPLPRPPERASHPIKILSVCRLQTSKRIDWILAALAGRHDLPDWELNVVGDGSDRARLVDLTQQLGLSDRVVFHGFLSDQDLDELYRKVHIFAMPARQGYGLPALEALYRRVAVVVSSDSGVVEILQDTPWVAVSRGDVEAFGLTLRGMIHRVADPRFFEGHLPELPTEDSSMEELMRYLWGL